MYKLFLQFVTEHSYSQLVPVATRQFLVWLKLIILLASSISDQCFVKFDIGLTCGSKSTVVTFGVYSKIQVACMLFVTILECILESI